MVLEFGLLKSGLFNTSENTGEGLGSDTQQQIISYRSSPSGQYFGIRFNNLKYDGVLAVFSPLIWVNVNGGNSSRTTDGGLTWSTLATDNSEMDAVIVCRADKTKAISYHTDTSDVYTITSDSGATWALSAGVTVNLTFPTDVDYPTASRAVVVGQRAAGTGAYYSTDGGNNWTQATTGIAAGHFYCVAMYDGLTGYAITLAKDIYKTTDGGVNWTDTTHNFANAPDANPERQSCWCVSATVLLFARTGYDVERYDNVAGTVTSVIKCPNIVSGGYALFTNFLKMDNNLYFARSCGDASYGYSIIVYKSEDGGLSWQAKIMPHPVEAGTAIASKTLLSEYDDNKFVLWLGDGTAILSDEN